MPAPAPRYQTRKARSGWYVYDTHTRLTIWPGLAHAGARQLADRLNRTTT